jgi:hypothetical protein
MIGRAILLAGLCGLGACAPEPRSASFFEANAEEAERVAAACEKGAHRGDECVNATAGLAALARKTRMDAYREAF